MYPAGGRSGPALRRAAQGKARGASCSPRQCWGAPRRRIGKAAAQITILNVMMVAQAAGLCPWGEGRRKRSRRLPWDGGLREGDWKRCCVLSREDWQEACWPRNCRREDARHELRRARKSVGEIGGELLLGGIPR